MKRKLSPWCKAVKIAMIQKDWGVADLAQAVKMTKEYTSAVINGRVISEPAVKVISDVLNIEQTALSQRRSGFYHRQIRTTAIQSKVVQPE